MAKVVSSAAMAASMLAFGSSCDLPFLAMGSTRATESPPCLAIFRSVVGAPGVERLDFASCFPSPSPFCRLSCSKAREATCFACELPAGLVAGGLESGAVAVWDPRSLLQESPGSESTSSTDLMKSVVENYFVSQEELPLRSGYTRNLAVEILLDPSSNAFLMVEGHQDKLDSHLAMDNTNTELQSLESDGKVKEGLGKWLVPFNMIEEYFSSEATPAPKVTRAPGGSESDMVALLHCHSGPVRGLSFSETTPHFLASGGAKGKLMVWDLTNPREEIIPNFQCTHAKKSDISYVSWNNRDPHVLTSASTTGVAFWDIRSHTPLTREISLNERCSVVEWSPVNKDVLVVGAEDGNVPALKVWDVRKLSSPRDLLCENTGGIVALSWSPFNEDILLACTKRKAFTLNVKEGKVVFEEELAELNDFCFDIKFSPLADCIFALASSNEVRLHEMED